MLCGFTVQHYYVICARTHTCMYTYMYAHIHACTHHPHHHLIHCQPTEGEGLPKLVPFTSVLCRSHPCRASKLQFQLSIIFLPSLTLRTCHWSPFCYLCPPVVLSSGKVSCPSLFLDFNLFYDILDFSLFSDPFTSFSISLGNS